MRVRKNQRFLSNQEKENFVNAYQAVRAKVGQGIARPRLLEFVRAHDEATNNTNRPITHGAMFLSWHRAHLMAFEDRLQQEDDSVSLPFWNAYRDPYPDWLLEVPNVSRPNNPGVDGENLPAIPFSEDNFATFQNEVNGGYHVEVHNQLGGAMGTMGRANRDPVFWLHHVYIDRIWSQWMEEYWSSTPGQNGQADYRPANRNDPLPDEFEEDTQYSTDTNAMLFTPAMDYVYGAGIYRNLERHGSTRFDKTIEEGMIISVEEGDIQAKVLVKNADGRQVSLQIRQYRNWIPEQDLELNIRPNYYWHIESGEIRSTPPAIRDSGILYFSSATQRFGGKIIKAETKNGARAAEYRGGIEYKHLLP